MRILNCFLAIVAVLTAENERFKSTDFRSQPGGLEYSFASLQRMHLALLGTNSRSAAGKSVSSRPGDGTPLMAKVIWQASELRVPRVLACAVPRGAVLSTKGTRTS